MKNTRILFIGKTNHPSCAQAAQSVKAAFTESEIFMGSRAESFPRSAYEWSGDYIFSYLSPWIIPEKLLKKAHKASLNFHPGPPEYPGIGCTNFSLYNQEKTFGITCHHMAAQVDTGPIVAVRRFQIYESDTVYTLTQRCYDYIHILFYEIFDLILKGKPLPKSDEHWTRQPYKRKELDELCRLTPSMSKEEIKRRVRAVTFPNAPGAYMDVDGKRIEYTPEHCD